MVYRQTIRFSVGKREKDDCEKIMLSGAVFEPQGPRKGTLILTPGLTSTWRHYNDFCSDLASAYTVIVYSLRGHGSSQGYFSPLRASHDLTCIIEQNSEPVGLIGHSIGASVSMRVADDHKQVKAVHLLSPYLSKQSFSPGRANLLAFVRGLCLVPGTIDIADALLHYSCIGHALGFNNKRPFRDFSNLQRTSMHNPKKTLGIALSDNDKVLGTTNAQHNEQFRNLLKEFYKVFCDHSEYVCGLNHCLNQSGYRPFCKPEQGKRRDELLEAMTIFFSEAFETTTS